MDYSGCPDDASFGPSVHGCRRRDFDFTLKFEFVFFSILPAAVFILLDVIRLVWLRRKPVIAKGRVFQFAKLVCKADSTYQLNQAKKKNRVIC